MVPRDLSCCRSSACLRLCFLLSFFWLISCAVRVDEKFEFCESVETETQRSVSLRANRRGDRGNQKSSAKGEHELLCSPWHLFGFEEYDVSEETYEMRYRLY